MHSCNDSVGSISSDVVRSKLELVMIGERFSETRGGVGRGLYRRPLPKKTQKLTPPSMYSPVRDVSCWSLL